MDASTIQLWAQAPLLGGLCLFFLYLAKQHRGEIERRDTSYLAMWKESLTEGRRIGDDYANALRELTQEHLEAQRRMGGESREASSHILAGQADMRQTLGKISVLLTAQMTDMEPKDAKAFVREILGTE